jgi:lauroyl/myristoyl acyltransferase
LEFYGNAVYPAGGSSWTFRGQLAFLFPKLSPAEKKALIEQQLRELEQQQQQTPKKE